MSSLSHQEDDEAQKRADRKARLYDAIRRQIEHEDGLVNQRFTWALNSSGFLFAGYFLILTNIDKFLEDNLVILLIFIIVCICGFGCFSCILYTNSISHANKSLSNLRKIWNNNFPEERNRSCNYLAREYPPIHHWSKKHIQSFRQSGAKGIIKLLLLGWVIFGLGSIFFIIRSNSSLNNKNNNEMYILVGNK